MIRAILRAQILSMRGFSFLRDPAAWISAIPSLLFYVVFTLAAVGAAFIFATADNPAKLASTLAVALLVVAAYWQLAPILTVSTGASLDLQKLLAYPIPVRKLFIVEVLLRVLNVMEMLLVLAGVGAGLALNPLVGGPAAIPRILIALVPFVLLNVLIAAGLRSLIERFFQRKRIKEITGLIFLLLCLTPRFFVYSGVHWQRALPFLPLQSVLPWSAAASVALWQTASTGAAGLAILLLWTAAAYRFGEWQFYRSIHSDPFAGREPAAPRTGSAVWSDPLFRLPGRFLRDPVAAMVEKDLRSLSRSSGARQAFIMGFTFGILILLPRGGAPGNAGGFLRNHFITWVSFYSLLLMGTYTFWNAFGYDRDAVQFYFVAPISFRLVITAKNVAAACVQALELLLITLVFLILPLPFRWGGVLEACSVTAVALLYLFAMGNYTSVRSPSALDPEKARGGRGGRGSRLMMMLILPLALLPIALAFWGGHVFHSQSVFYLLLLVAAVIGAIVYWVATDSAVQLSITRREEFSSALALGQGPLSVT